MNITSEQARDFQRRWKAVNEAEIAELRATPPEVKFRQLVAMADSVDELGWNEKLREGEDEVRARWGRLRRAVLG